jgi:hypothetical protein
VIVAADLVSTLLAVLLAVAAVRKLSHRKSIVASYARVGVPEERLNLLAFVLLLGAAGLLIGQLWTPIGVAAAACVTAYFTLAAAAHVRHHDLGQLPTPLALLGLAVASLLLQLLQ